MTIVRTLLALTVLGATTTATQTARSTEQADPAPARRLSAIEVLVEPDGLIVTLAGDGRLRPSSIREAEQCPPRLVVDLPGVAAAVPGVTTVGVGPVSDIRVLAQSVDPLVTRVVFELVGRSDYRIEDTESSAGPLRFVFPLDREPSDLQSHRHSGEAPPVAQDGSRPGPARVRCDFGLSGDPERRRYGVLQR